jgi:hypothetical protein
MRRYGRDFWGGVLMSLLGIGAVVQGSTYRVGSLTHMGSGFFPVAVGALLALVGFVMTVTAMVSAAPAGGTRLPAEWRSWLLICASVIGFAVIGTYGGLIPATFAIVFISALADRSNTVRGAAILSVAVVIVGVTVFWWLLQVQFPLFRWGSA